jgi:hypothetical protein
MIITVVSLNSNRYYGRRAVTSRAGPGRLTAGVTPGTRPGLGPDSHPESADSESDDTVARQRIRARATVTRTLPRFGVRPAGPGGGRSRGTPAPEG